MNTFARHFVITAIILGLLAGLLVYAGVYNVSARAGHLPPTAWLLHVAMRKSARTHAFGIDVPPLEDERMIIRGATYFGHEILEEVALGDHPDRDRPDKRLSEREYEVFCLIARGKTVTVIAAELALSVKTVSTYRKRVLEKMNMSSNAELYRYAVHHSLVS